MVPGHSTSPIRVHTLTDWPFLTCAKEVRSKRRRKMGRTVKPINRGNPKHLRLAVREVELYICLVLKCAGGMQARQHVVVFTCRGLRVHPRTGKARSAGVVSIFPDVY